MLKVIKRCVVVVDSGAAVVVDAKLRVFFSFLSRSVDLAIVFGLDVAYVFANVTLDFLFFSFSCLCFQCSTKYFFSSFRYLQMTCSVLYNVHLSIYTHPSLV